MSTHFYVPGPADLGTGTGSSKAMQFLGYTRDGVHVREDLLTRAVIADYAGPQMPADVMIIGKILTFTCELVKFDPAVMTLLMARYSGGTAGLILANEIGTLMVAEGRTIPVMVRSRYQAAKSQFSGNLPGIRMPNGFLDQSHEYNLATIEQSHRLTFTQITTIDSGTLSGTVWDTDMSTFPSPT